MEVTYIGHCGSDLTVVNAARVSFNKKSDWSHELGEGKPVGAGYPLTLNKADKKLVSYLAEHEHYSPFNHCFITMHIKAPIFVARQLVKHEYMPWNEVSRRYVDYEPEFYEPSEWRGRPDKSIKQGSEGTIDITRYDVMGHRSPESVTEHPSLADRYTTTIKETMALYDALLESGVAPEHARIILPQNMYTEWYWSGTLKAWAKMYMLRASKDAQVETQYIALEAGKIIRGCFPVSWKALTNGKI